MDIDVLIKRYPQLYHMAEKDSWPSIQKHGLLSTSALLDLHDIEGEARNIYESLHRPEKYSLTSDKVGTSVLRDQKPMSEKRLKQCLQDGLTPEDWYELLNAKVFFWVSYERLTTLLNARAYRNDEHDVLTLETEPLVIKYAQEISLCHMNSGNTFPVPHRRGKTTFISIKDYPTLPRSGKPIREVVELVVEYRVPDIREYVISVDRMKGGDILHNLYSR